MAVDLCRTRVVANRGRTIMAADFGRTIISADPGRTIMSADPGRTIMAADPRRTRLAADSGRTRLAADPGRTRLAADPVWARLAADLIWARLATDSPWSSMAVHSCSFRLGDNGRICEDIGSSQRIYRYQRLRCAFTVSFSSNPAVQDVARFLDVSSLPGIKTPTLFHLRNTRKSSTGQGDHSCHKFL